MAAKAKSKRRILTYAQAISEAHVQTMDNNPHCFVMGLGVTDYKGIFGTTITANKLYGPRRVIEVPASENALSGIAMGTSLMGKRPVIIHARNDFMFLALDQMLNGASKWRYMYAGKSKVPFVVRSIIGKGWGQGPTHSQSIQSVFMHFPGLYIAMPSTPYDAKGLLIAALHENTPCLIIEHRRLYDTIGFVPKKMYRVEFGESRLVRRGSDITLVATSLMVNEGVKAHLALQKMGISLEVLDPRSLRPLDEKAILRSVKKTGRLICADTSWTSCGVSSEISATVSEKAFGFLKAPIKRIGLAECPSPVSLKLEQRFYPTYKDIFVECCKLLNKRPNYELISDPIIDTFKGPY